MLGSVTFVIWILSTYSFAATYYVAKSGGNDANSCTHARSQNTPKQTIQAGVACAVAAGDTVIVKAGTYTESVSVYSSGAHGKPIAIKTNPGDTVIWTNAAPRNSWRGALNIQNQSYIRIEGFTFQGSRAVLTLFVLNTLGKSSPMQGIEIINNTFIDNGTTGAPDASAWMIYLVDLGRDGSYSGPNVNLISGNTFTNNYGYHMNLSNTSDTYIANNRMTGGKGSAEPSNGNLYVANFVSFGGSGAQRNVIESNIISDFDVSRTTNVELSGVRCDVGGRNNTIRNNTIYNILYGVPWNSNQFVYGMLLEASCNQNLVKNNIIFRTSMACITLGWQGVSIADGNTIDGNVGYQCKKVGLDLGHAKNTLVKNNIFQNNGAEGGAQVRVTSHSVRGGNNVFSYNNYKPSGGTLIGVWNGNYSDPANLTLSQWKNQSGEINSMSADALFVNPPSDFRLQAGSPARGAGENGIDTGAYPQSGSTAPAPNAPTNLQLTP
jgi:parallel beta-helix repeat protein